MGNTKTKYHPLTGKALEPIWVSPSGRVFWPIMGGDDTVPPATPPATPPADPATPPATPPPSDPPPASKQPPWGKPEDFDAEKAWELIQNLRASDRPGKVAELETKVAEMTAAQQAQMDALAKALGLKPDDAPPDPAKLTEQIEAEKANAAEAQRQLAVFQNAGEADPKRLLDSASFLRSIKDIDPTDTAKIAAAVAAAIEADPLLKAVHPPSTPPFPGGPRTPAPSQAGSLSEAINKRLTQNNR